NPAIGSLDAQVILHELGHNLGLKHSFGSTEPNGHGLPGKWAHGTLFPNVPPDHNSHEYSVMAYSRFPGGPNALTQPDNDSPTTYMQDDIQALQYMYGANYNTHNEDSIYKWDPSTGQEFINGVGQVDRNGEIAPSDHEIFMTVWDGGGNDTYDF